MKIRVKTNIYALPLSLSLYFFFTLSLVIPLSLVLPTLMHLCPFVSFGFSFHPPKFQLLFFIPFPLKPSSLFSDNFHDIILQDKFTSLLHIFDTLFHSHSAGSLSSYSFLIILELQLYHKMDTALTKATESLLIPALSYLVQLLSHQKIHYALGTVLSFVFSEHFSL